MHYKPTVTSLQNYQSVLQVSSLCTSSLCTTSLCTTSLTQLAYLNASFQLSLVSTIISSIYYFSSHIQGYCPSPNITLSALHVAAAFQQLAKQTITVFPLSVAHRVSDLKISGAMTFLPFVYCEFYDGWLRTASNCGLAVVVLNKQMNQKCSATPLNKNLSLPNFGAVPAYIWRH